MGRMLYEGQRSISNERVWSINRNYYLGAGRYGYAEWSGDMTTGFQSMAYQRRRMVTSLNLGESQWSMDIGRIYRSSHAENYARWMEFGAFVPIFRLHGSSMKSGSRGCMGRWPKPPRRKSCAFVMT